MTGTHLPAQWRRTLRHPGRHRERRRPSVARTASRLHPARALAAVGSNDLDNVAVAVTAHGGRARARRSCCGSGEHEAIAETRSLLPLGTTRDVTRMCATYVVTWLLGLDVSAVIGSDDEVYVETAGDGFTPWPTSPRCTCAHRA